MTSVEAWMLKIMSASLLPTSASFCCLKLHHALERIMHGKDDGTRNY